MELSPKQQRFVTEYLVDLNATQAAIRSGYSDKSARWIGSELLGNPLVAEAIGQGQKHRADRLEISQDMVLQELAKIAFSNMGRLAKWGGGEAVQYLSSEDVSDWDKAAIAEINDQSFTNGRSGETRTSTRIKLHDKIKALELVGKHIGMWQQIKDDGSETDRRDPSANTDAILLACKRVRGAG